MTSANNDVAGEALILFVEPVLSDEVLPGHVVAQHASVLSHGPDFLPRQIASPVHRFRGDFWKHPKKALQTNKTVIKFLKTKSASLIKPSKTGIPHFSATHSCHPAPKVAHQTKDQKNLQSPQPTPIIFTGRRPHGLSDRLDLTVEALVRVWCGQHIVEKGLLQKVEHSQRSRRLTPPFVLFLFALRCG